MPNLEHVNPDYLDGVGFRVIDGIVFEYECVRCTQILAQGGHWTQQYVDRFHGGKLRKLNERHKELKFPYGHLHQVKRIR